MSVRCVAFATVVALVLGIGVPPVHAGRMYFDDPVGDPVDCNTDDALPDRGIGDIRGLGLAWPGAGAPDDDLDGSAVEVRMAQNAEEAYETAFSYAVMLLGYVGPAGDTVRQFLLEVHSGERRIGEFDPESGEPVESDAEVTVTGDTVMFDLGVDLSAFSKLEVQAFSLPVEGDPTSCDRLEVGEDELAAGGSDADLADDDGTAIEGDEPTDAVPTDDAAVADESDGGLSAGLLIGLGLALAALVALLGWLFGPWSWSRGGGVGDDDGPLPPPDSAVDDVNPLDVI